ncbi:MAG TPA: DUF4870 domain-containing protein [Thermoplasmatales archaeon]|nr:DUF4870 domain-containing protein [Thermoplasmatales archaeon]
MAKTSMNMEENTAGLLSYVGIWITGIIFYFMEKENKTVKFHALQSILTFLPLNILICIFLIIPFFGWIIAGLLILLLLILWLILIIKAYQGEKFKLPVVGDIAEKHA